MAVERSSSRPQADSITRRELLTRGAALVAFTLAGRALCGRAAQAAGSLHNPDGWAMLVDLTECIGCRSCTYACQEANGWTGDPEREAPDGHRWTAVREVNLPGRPDPVRYVRVQCFHCLEPACVSACPVAALRKTPEGPVVYDAQRCMGCRYCLIACPFHIPRYQWDQTLPVVAKCTLCAARLAKGELPACAEACPTGATIFGRRSELVAEARRRIESRPGRYVDRIYGLAEAGGTSWLFLSDVPFEDLGFPQVGTTAPADFTRLATQAVPVAALGVAGLLTLVYRSLNGHAEGDRAAPASQPTAENAPPGKDERVGRAGRARGEEP